MGRFKDKVALITDASSAVGQAIRNQLKNEGAKVAASSADGSANGDLSLTHDVTSAESWETVLAETVDKLGDLHVLVNIADSAYKTPKPIVETSLEEFRAVNALNLEGTFLGLRYGVVKMRELEHPGAVVNVAPAFAMIGAANQAAFCSSANGIRMMTKSAALSCAESKDKIRINCVQVGAIDGTASGRVIDGLNDKPLIPLKRKGTVADVAAAVTFLASEEAYYITGYLLAVDGGMLAA